MTTPIYRQGKINKVKERVYSVILSGDDLRDMDLSKNADGSVNCDMYWTYQDAAEVVEKWIEQGVIDSTKGILSGYPMPYPYPQK